VPRIAGSRSRHADTITGEGVGHLIEPPGNEPQLKPSQGSGRLAQTGEGVVIVPILPELNERRAIGVHTQVACTPGDRRLNRRQKGGLLGFQWRQRAARLAEGGNHLVLRMHQNHAAGNNRRASHRRRWCWSRRTRR